MKKIISALTIAVFAANAAIAATGDVATWATATSTHATNGRVIVFRYAKEFGPTFKKSNLPDRVILVWRYQSESGMPTTAEREAMEQLEDLLLPLIEKPGLAALSLVSTGENLREWTYYAKSETEFLQALNKALSGQPRFPIEVHAGPDPMWSTYERFRKGVRE